MARKMHFALEDIANDCTKVSEATKESISTIYQPQNKSTSLEDCIESSLSRINSDSRCAILTLINFEPDGSWRIFSVPVRCHNHVNLTSVINMDGLQLLFHPPIDRLKIDQCKGSRGSPPPYSYSVKSLTRNNFTSSNVRRRCQNKIANRASKLNEVPGNSCTGSSLVCGPGSFTDSPEAVNSSVNKLISNAKDDKSLKKNSRKRIKKKVKQSKKQSSESSGSTEGEVLTEDYVCASLASETCGNNDVGKEVGLTLYATAPEFSSSDDRLIKNGCERNETNDNTGVTEATKSCNSYMDQEARSKATAPTVQNSSEEIKNLQDAEIWQFNDIQDSLVLDSVSVGSKSDESTSGDIVKGSNKASSRITSASQNLMNGVRNNGEHNEGTRHGGQNCMSNDKRVKQMRAMSKSSSFNKFGGVGALHGRAGKENSHSVWQKVQKNGNDECGGDLRKANTTLSQSISTVEKDPSAIMTAVSKTENKRHMKSKVGRKSKSKMDTVAQKGHCNYSRKGSHLNGPVLNYNGKVSAQQNDRPYSSSQEIGQQGLSSVTGFETDINCQISEVEESDPQNSLCQYIGNMQNENIGNQRSTLLMPDEDINESNMSQEQSPVSHNLLLDDEVCQTEKEVSSADYNAQNHSSGSILWKWIPVGKKDTGMAKSESNSSSPEYFDSPTSKSIDLESIVEPKVTSFSQNQDSSLNASRTMAQISDKFSCLDEGENHKLVRPVACTLTEHKDKHVAANHVIYESESQYLLESDSYRIAKAVNDACRAQLACEAVHMATGGPIAEFERLLHFCSPVICESPNSLSCLSCSQDHAGNGVSLCRHEVPDISLGYLWQRYEKHGCYGLEIKAQDYENPNAQGCVGHFPFRAYFVPSLSAVQLFKNHENECECSKDKSPNSEACESVDDSENSSTPDERSIFSVLFPQPRNQDASTSTQKKTASISDASSPSIDSTCSSDSELLFEYFELEQPQQRRPLYEKIQELVRGNIPIQSKTYGDPTKLDSINLRDLHPRSWYSVAWYPIYRIPEGNFRAAFLTYHSLGHLIRRSANSDSPTVGSKIVSPAVGLQSYNAQGECWFQLNDSALSAKMPGLNPSLLLKERLRTLEETASLMARSVVSKGNLKCTNRHSDYEFFLSRRRY